MHTISEIGTTVPAFLGKLWKLVEDPETDDLICWAPNGRSFFIRNQAHFARELLPHYYKHNNMASFVRQLNMYGFHKKVSVDLGGLKCDRDEMEFAHQYFCKGHPYLLEHIKRKIASSKGQDPTQAPMKPELMNKMLSEVRTMRGRQEHLDSRLGAMKRENEALWRELAMLRQKHLKQQQIVNKLIHFLVTLVQPNRSGGLSVKRRYPLMIDDHNRQRSKQSKMSKPQQSPTGPVIHELDASEPDLDSEYIVAEMLENHQNPAIQSPEEHRENPMDDDDDIQHMETTVHLIDDSNQLEVEQLIEQQEHELEMKKRRPKGKKKEETLLLDVPSVESPDSADSMEKNNMSPGSSKPIPLATVRSSKLTAMVANMNKGRNYNKADAEYERLNDETAERVRDKDGQQEQQEQPVAENEDNVVNLEDILIIPDVLNSSDINESNDANVDDNNSVSGNSNGRHSSLSNVSNVSNNTNNAGNGSTSPFTNAASVASSPEADPGWANGATTSANSASPAKNLSLSCVNPSGISDATYRLGSMEEMDNHLESMQSELDNLREILRSEGYSIDANTLLGLFGADDPMSFGVPVNPELDPQREREDEERQMFDSGNNKELMAYNPATSLLDFDDDIFLGATSSSPGLEQNAETNPPEMYSNDPLDLEDSKASLLDSLVSGGKQGSPKT